MKKDILTGFILSLAFSLFFGWPDAVLYFIGWVAAIVILRTVEKRKQQ